MLTIFFEKNLYPKTKDEELAQDELALRVVARTSSAEAEPYLVTAQVVAVAAEAVVAAVVVGPFDGFDKEYS